MKKETTLKIIGVIVIVIIVSALYYYGFFYKMTGLKGATCQVTVDAGLSSEQEGVITTKVVNGKYVKGKCITV